MEKENTVVNNDELTTDSSQQHQNIADDVKNVNEAENTEELESIEDPYKLMYEELQTKYEREKETRKYEREKRKKLQEEKENLENSNIDEEMIENIVKEKIDKTIDPYLKQLNSNQLKSAINSITNNEHKAKLIEEVYNTRIKLSGNLEYDLIAAESIVDGIVVKQRAEKEIKKSYAKKFAASRTGGNLSNKRKEYTDKVIPVYTKEEKAFLEMTKQVFK